MDKTMLDMLLHLCADDMRKIPESGRLSLDAQVRAYDLLSGLLDEYSGASYSQEAAENFRNAYLADPSSVEAAYDGNYLLESVKARLEPLNAECTEARFAAAAAAGLHEFAKETFDTWENGGVFMKRRALKALRERAGFRLESHRIGNYVAKTFDLMNEAQVRFASLQQKVFAADVTYKIRPGLHARIYDILSK